MDFGTRIKYFNYRPLVSIWLFMMTGVIFAVGMHVGSIFYFILSLAMFALFSSTLIVKAIVAKRNKIFKILSVILAFILSAGVTFGILNNYDSDNIANGNYDVVGRVYTYTSKSESGFRVVSLDNVTIKDVKNNKTNKLSCRVRLYLDESDGSAKEFELGDIVEGNFSLKNAEYFRDGDLNFYLNNHDINILGFGNEDDVSFTGKTNRNIFDKIKIKVKSILNGSINNKFGELGFTMLFGDKSGLEADIRESYSESGIGHLLAVSGLHVGFVVALFSLFLSLFKVGDKAKFFIITTATFIYAFLCGFSVSVTRALIMTVILLFSKLRKRKYDSLSSLALAGIIILMWNPLFVFDVGFILSFSAVASIIIFSRTFTIFFSKFLHNKLASALAVSLSASVGTSLTMMVCFEKLSLFSVITNVVAIPIASVAYMIMFMCVILALIIPPLGVLLNLFEFLMRIVTGISQLTSSFSLVGLNKFAIYSFGSSLTLTAIFLSDYAILNKKEKISCVSVFLTLTLVSGLMMFIC